MIWTILIIKKSDNGWYINYIEQKILKQISINNLQNFVDVIVFDPKIKFSSKYVSVIDNYIEISDSFVSDIYNIMSNSNADCIGLKGLNYIDGNSCMFSNISDGSSLILPITTLNPIKLDIIVSKLQNIHYYINSENLSNVVQSIDSINTPVIFMQDTTNKLPFSIIITAYQTQNYIEECLDSIENQSYFKENDNYEILVGVDACQDTFDKLNEIKHKYRNLKIYMMNDNKGTYITTNTLIGLTKHENIIRFDSDDIMTPNLVKELVKDKGSSDIVLLGYLDFEDNIIGKKLAVAGIIYFKKSVMDIAGGYQPWRCAADTELISRLANKVKIHQLKKAVFYRRIHENSLTRRDDTKHDSEIRNYYTSLIKRNYSDNEIKIERVVNGYQKNKQIYPISIIVTAYQTQNYIEECLDSIENQTYFKDNDNYEVLLGIDACEETLNKVKEIMHKYRNLRVFMMDSNMGTYVTSNTLLDLIQYENILRFDSDDIMKPFMIEEIMKNNNNYDLIQFQFDTFKESINIVNKNVGYAKGVIFYKKSIFDIAGGYKDWMCAADSELIERIKNFTISNKIKKSLFFNRLHEKSLTNNCKTNLNSELRLNYHKEIKCYNELKDIKITKRVNNFISLNETDKYSIIIPTMWKSDYLYNMLDIYETNNHIGEIIIIDNDPNNKPNLEKYKKIKYYTEGKNIYVNPAWNIGYSLSKYNTILANDDILISNFNEMINLISKEKKTYDIIGMLYGDTYNKLDIKNIDNFPANSYGSFMYIKNYIYIPNEIKIWAGDYILFMLNKKRGILNNPHFKTIPSITVNSNKYFRDTIGKNDLKLLKDINIDNFSKIKDKMISVNLATYPKRKEYFTNFMINLLNIDIIDIIRVYLNEYDKIPEDFPKSDKILYHLGENKKDSGKFYWAKEFKNEYYFSVDDDLLYSKQYFINHIKTLRKYKNKIFVTTHGKILQQHASKFDDFIKIYHFNRTLKKDIYVNMCGTGVLLFDNNNYKIDDIFKYDGMTDLWISKYCQENKIPIVCRSHDIELKYMLSDTDETLWDDRSSFTVEHNEILSSINNWRLYKFKKFKIGAIYNTFYGLELIEKSINSIKDAVDYIVIVHQTIGFNGNKEPDNNNEILKYLKINNLVDDIIYYEPNGNLKNEKLGLYLHNEIRNKRNIGLNYCKNNNCEYIIPMDSDELYNSNEILNEISIMNNNNIDTLYSPIYSYYYDEYHYFKDSYYVPSVFKVNDRVFEKITNSNILADPARRMDERKYRISNMYMHHLTFLKKSFSQKINNKLGTLTSNIVRNGAIDILNYLNSWKDGDDALIFANDANGEVILNKIKLNKIMINSNEYWKNRYKNNGNSGSGSYGNLADFKAKIINKFIIENNIKNIGEFGCGDGNQLKYFNCEKYTGYDISEDIIELNKKNYKLDNSKVFKVMDSYNNQKFDLSLSLDVIFHLIEDYIFNEYMNNLFNSSNKYVIIYSSNGDIKIPLAEHLKDRKFTDWISDNMTDFKLIKIINNEHKFNINNPNNTSFSDFYIYEKINK